MRLRPQCERSAPRAQRAEHLLAHGHLFADLVLVADGDGLVVSPRDHGREDRLIPKIRIAYQAGFSAICQRVDELCVARIEQVRKGVVYMTDDSCS